MFQIGGFVAFCGLLAQTTAQLGKLPLPLKPVLDLPSSPTDLAGKLTNAVSNGLLSGGLPDALKNLPVQDFLKNVGGNSGGLMGGLLRDMNSLTPLLKVIDVTISNPKLLKLNIEQSSDGHSLYINIPLGMDVDVNVPLYASLIKMNLKLNITGEISAVKDEQGKVHLVLGNCTNSPGELKILLLKGRLPISVDKLLGKLTGLLSKVIPMLTRSQVCSLLNKVLGNLDVALVYNIASKLIPGVQLDIKL